MNQRHIQISYHILKFRKISKNTNSESFTTDDELLTNRLLEFKQGKTDLTIDLTRFITSSDTLNPDHPELNIAPTRPDLSTGSHSTANTNH